MSLRIKCFVSGKMWLSGKDCGFMQGITDRMAVKTQSPTPRVLKRQGFWFGFFFFLFSPHSAELWDGMGQTTRLQKVLHFSYCRVSPFFFCILKIKPVSLTT